MKQWILALALIVGLTLFALALPVWSEAADKYVRPLGGSYGAEDGTSYPNAFRPDIGAYQATSGDPAQIRSNR